MNFRTLILPHCSEKSHDKKAECGKRLQKDCLVDCGAFCGENSLAFQTFLQERGKAPPQVIAIEPDEKNHREMQRRLKKIQSLRSAFIIPTRICWI